ncbi:MAG: AAA family ATPase, partial [Porphyromonas sp.]|uniref:ATP-dependent DNA helicase n=1 Tax=Porphyromonas sp. TaxID=1924944 RepID=UPI001CAD91B5
MPYTALLSALSSLPLDGYTSDQREALGTLYEYIEEPSPYALFLLTGYAGTGKTFLLRTIADLAQRAGLRVELMASTGRAAKVLSASTGRPASTIHRTIYRASTQMQEEGGSFQLGRVSGATPTLFIVDEASMISGDTGEMTPFGSGNLLDDLLSYVWSADEAKLIFVGDTAQLPPVGTPLSDALNAEVLTSRYGLHVYGMELREVVRQKRGGILHNATQLRELLDEYADEDPEEILPIHLETEGWRGIFPVEGGTFIETLDEAYRKYGEEECLVICPSNKLALECNHAIRSSVLFYEEEPVVRGERLIVARNNYHYTKRPDRSDFIANGEIIEVQRIGRHYYEYGLHFADATIYLPDRDDLLDVRLLLTSLEDPTPQRSQAERQRLFELIAADYADIPSVTDRRKAIRRDPFWGALEVKYGYATTAHKAQGGQWSCVFID